MWTELLDHFIGARHDGARRASSRLKTNQVRVVAARSKSNWRNLEGGSTKNRVTSQRCSKSKTERRFRSRERSSPFSSSRDASASSHSRARDYSREIRPFERDTCTRQDLYRCFSLRAAEYKIVFQNSSNPFIEHFAHFERTRRHDIAYPSLYLHREQLSHTERRTFKRKRKKKEATLNDRQMRRDTRVRSQHERLCTEGILFQTRREYWMAYTRKIFANISGSYVLWCRLC